LSPEQVKVILTVNKALKSGQIPREVAISTLMHTLGLDEEQAAVFIPAEEPEEDLETGPGVEPGAEKPTSAESAESETPTDPTDEDESVDDDIGEEDDEDEKEKKKVD
jgi:hypothetical protein